MPDDVDREIERLEHEEERREAGWGAVIDLARSAEFGDRLAGIWQEEDVLYVAVTDGRERADAALAGVAGGAPVVVTLAEHPLHALEALAERIWAEDERLGAGLGATGVMEQENRVEAMVADLAAPAAVTLRARFAGEPVTWVEGTVVAAV